MGDVHDGNSFFLIEFFHDVHNVAATCGIQHRRGFVKHDNARFHCKNPRNRDTLFLSAAHIVRRRAAIFQHVYGGQRVGDATADFFTRDAQVFGTESHVVFNDARHHLVVGILKHDADVFPDFVNIFVVFRVMTENENVARTRQKKPVKMLRKRGFSAAVCADQCQKLPFVYRKGDVFQSVDGLRIVRLIAIAYVFDLNDFHKTSIGNIVA